MHDHDLIKRTVTEVLAEQKRLHNNEADEVVLRTINLAFTSFGIEEEDRQEMRLDFQHLRRWRRASEHVEKTAWMAIIGVLVSGIVGLIWMGIQSKFGGK